MDGVGSIGGLGGIGAEEAEEGLGREYMGQEEQVQVFV